MKTTTAIDGKDYKVTEYGTYYPAVTPDALIYKLEAARIGERRVRIFCGFTTDGYPATGNTEYKNGEAWPEENDVTGYIGRTRGPIKSPILLKSNRSSGGGIISTNSIVALMIDGEIVWKHEGFTTGQWDVVALVGSDKIQVLHNRTLHASFQYEPQAKRYAAFMRGERMGM